MRNIRLVVSLMFLAFSLLVGQGRVAARETAEETRPAEVSYASRLYNRAREERNKAIVQRVYDEIFGQGQTDLVNELFSEIYIQHNPTLPNGRQALIDFVKFLKSLNPAPVITVKHILADGDLVAVHWHASATPDNEFTGQAGFDLFRLCRQANAVIAFSRALDLSAHQTARTEVEANISCGKIGVCGVAGQ